jgi:hypothetical protein
MLFVVADLKEVAAGSFGVAAALLLVGGSILLRYQRDRHHFILTQAALEKGLTALPNGLPVWVVSLRQGILVMVLGIGLLAAGAGTCILATTLPGPPAAATRPVRLPPGYDNVTAQPQPAPARPDGPAGPPPEGPHFMPNPEMDHWQRMQNIQLGGVVTLAVGGIVFLLGLVRILFAGAEKKYLNV